MLLAYFDNAIKINSLPYSEYWLPLVIGLGIGVTFLVVARTFLGGPARLPAVPKKHREYDPFTQGSPTEQRKSFRRTGNPVDVQYALPDDKKKCRLGWVFDRSVGGLGLVTTEAFEPGTVLAVHAVRGGEATPWVEVEVRTCRPGESSDFELGCQFVKTPPWSVLLLFG
jgi:hypothetical protein